MYTDDRATRRQTSMGYIRVIDAGRVAICSGASTEVVNWDDIILARSAKNYTWLATRRGAIRVRRPLQVVIDTLAALGLVQIHRRVAVNQTKVRRMVRSGNRQLALILDEELRLQVGRQFQRVVRSQFGAKAVGSRSSEPMTSQRGEQSSAYAAQPTQPLQDPS